MPRNVVAKSWSSLAVLGIGIGGLALASTPIGLAAQLEPEHPVSQGALQLRTIRDFGQPVIPLFEGWYTNPDGTHELCFGFFSLNRVQVLDIPVGPNNFLEPAQYDGQQPTHFAPLGPRTGRGSSSGSESREYCVFAVNVPADFGDQSVWWNLRIDGQLYRVPGRITVKPYMVDNLVNSVGAAQQEFMENRSGIGGIDIAPIVRFVEPAGPEGRGKGRGLEVGPITTRGADPVRITLAISTPSAAETGLQDVDLRDEDALLQQSVKWTEFSGPVGGVVTFSEPTARIRVPSEHTTQVTFSQPGDYVLLAQVLNGGFGNQCCWTNAYARVTAR